MFESAKQPLEITELERKKLSKSMNKIIPAGGISKQAIQMYQQKREAQMRIRSYNDVDDLNRELTIRDAINRQDQGYKQVYNQNSWNQEKRLAPKFRIYHHLNHRFRKSPTDLNKLKNQDLEEKFQTYKNLALKSKQESKERYMIRQLERSLIQSRAVQAISEQEKVNLESLETSDPILTQELLQKKKWTNVQKDPSRVLKDQFIDTTSYWLQLNNLPTKSVKNVVTDQVLQADKQGCEIILNKIIEQKHNDDIKRKKQMKERDQLRQKLTQRHNHIFQLEKTCGVRLGSLQTNEIKFEELEGLKNIQQTIDVSDMTDNQQQIKYEFPNEFSSIEAVTPEFLTFQRSTLPSKLSTMRTNNQEIKNQCNETLKLKFNPSRVASRSNQRENILAIPKPEYQGKDFFQRNEFRGMILADYQEAIGEKAFKCVEDINKSTVTQFSQLQSFQDSINQKKQIQSFYQQSRQESKIKKRIDSEAINLQSMQTQTSPGDIIQGPNLIFTQQKTFDVGSKIRAVTAAELSKDQRSRILTRKAYANSLGIEAGSRPKTSVQSAVNANDQFQQSDRIFKHDRPVLQTIDEKYPNSSYRVSSTTDQDKIVRSKTQVNQELIHLTNELKDFESRVPCEIKNSTKAVCRYPNIRLQQVMYPQTSQSTRNKIKVDQQNLV